MRIRVRSDILHLYRDVHSGLGILAGLFLFVAFYAGAITMFESPLQDWATPDVALPSVVSLDRAPELVARALAAHPEATDSYTVIVRPSRAHPARMEWSEGSQRQNRRGGARVFAGLDDAGNLVVARRAVSPAVGFVDVLHQQIGLPLPHEAAMPIMGFIALIYATALISGTLVFLPTLARNLFSLRLFGSAQKAWLDLHNLIGVFSLPFHIVMAVTSVVFAFHEQIFTVQKATFPPGVPAGHHRPVSGTHGPHAALPPARILATMEAQAPGLSVDEISYQHGGAVIRVTVHDARYSLRGPTSGFATVDPATGQFLSRDYLPGHQPRGLAVITVFFALHFGSFGGAVVRWLYALLGLGGAVLFYAGNRLWVVSRRRREQRSGRSEDSLATRLFDRLTPGWSFGCIAGISAVFCAIPALPDGSGAAPFVGLFYGVFLVCIAAAFVVPQRMSEHVPMGLAGIVTLAVVPVALFLRPPSPTSVALAFFALLAGGALLALAAWSRRETGRRTGAAPLRR